MYNDRETEFKMFDFNKIIDRSKTDSAKWLKYRDKDIIPLWVADMDFPSPPAVIEALHRRVDHGVFGYGMPSRSLEDSVITYLARAFNWQVEPRWIVWLPGLVTGLNVACRSTGGSEDSVITTVPIYPPFLSAPGFSSRELKTTRLLFSHDKWQVDFDHLDASMDAHTSLFLLCNPHNPTGRVFSKPELLKLGDTCLKHDVVICSDEIHCDLVLDADCRHIPIASLSPDIARRTITLMAPSKTFNIPGLSCSYAIIPDDSLRRRFKQAMAGIVPHVNVMGMVAAQASYDLGNSWLKNLIVYLRENRDLVYRTIGQLNGLKMAKVEATYLAWIDARQLSCSYPAKWFEQAGVGLSDGRHFDGNGFVRLNFGCPRPLLSKALDRMSTAVDSC
jgi:cystathionine beta-lyase